MTEDIEKEVRTDLSIHIANLNWLVQDLQNVSLETNDTNEKYKLKVTIQDTKVLKDFINHLNITHNATSK